MLKINTEHPHVARDVDDGALTALHHVLGGEAGDEEEPGGVDVQAPVVEFAVDVPLFQRAAQHRVVDEDIEMPALIHDVGDAAFDRLGGAEVEPQALHPRELRRVLAELVQVARGDEYRRPRLVERLGDLRAVAALVTRAARDQRDLAIQRKTFQHVHDRNSSMRGRQRSRLRQ